MKLVGFSTKSKLPKSAVFENLITIYERNDFQLLCDKRPLKANASNSFSVTFGEEYQYDSSEQNQDFLPDGNYVTVKIDNDGKVIVSTDPNCRIDIYYANSESVNIFSTDFSIVEEVLSEPLHLDQIAIAHSLSIYGNRAPKKRTRYSEVKRIGYKQDLILEEKQLKVRSGLLRIPQTRKIKNENEFLAEYSKAFLESLDRRASDSENLIFFSSGWDSTAIAAALVKLKGPGKVKCLIGDMKYEEQFSSANTFELERAQIICDHLKVELEVMSLDYAKDVPHNFSEIVDFLKVNQLGTFTSINHFRLAEAASKIAGDGARIFAGEMSDGAHNLGFSQFMSVFHPNSIDFREYSDKMRSYLFGPSFVKYSSPDNLSKDPVWNFITQNSLMESDTPKPDINSRILQFLESFFLRNDRIPFSPQSGLRFLTQIGARKYNEELSLEYFNELRSQFSVDKLYGLYIHLYNSFHWQGSTVNSLEISGNHFDLKVTNPFHDSNLVNLLQEMPEEMGRGLELKPTKYPLKWTLENELNYDVKINGGFHSYEYDVDPTFNHNEKLLYHSAMSEIFKNVLQNSNLTSMLDPEIFRLDYINNLKYLYLEGKKVHSDQITDLMSLCMHTLTL